MKPFLYLFTAVIFLLGVVPAHANDVQQIVTIDCHHPTQQKDKLVRPYGDSNRWKFTVELVNGASWVANSQHWSHSGGSGGSADPTWGQWSDGQVGQSTITWSQPEHTGDFFVTVTGQITCGGGGGGGPINIKVDWSGSVDKKKWDIGLGIGKMRQPDGTITDNGRIISPQDQRQDPPVPEKVIVAPGATVNLQIETATDFDHWIQGTQDKYVDDSAYLSYIWSAAEGSLTPANGNGKVATWTAPTDDNTYTIKCTIKDDPPPLGDDEEGIRKDSDLIREVQVKVAPLNITWTGLARSCAGGIGIDGVHDFTISGTAKHTDSGGVAANTALKLSFDGNKGQDHRAKFVVDNDQGGNDLVEETTVTTDAEGKFSVHVLSSDIVSSDIKIKVKWTDETGKEHDVGEKACDFAKSVSLRRFGLVFYPKDEDTGWVFGDATDPAYSDEIIASSGTTPAKVYLKFQVDPSISQDKTYFNNDGTPVDPKTMTDYKNWKAVSGHSLLIKIDSITAQPGSTFDGTISHYATLLDTNGQPTDEIEVVTSGDGTAQVSIKAGTKISHAKEVILSVKDISEHEHE